MWSAGDSITFLLSRESTLEPAKEQLESIDVTDNGVAATSSESSGTLDSGYVVYSSLPWLHLASIREFPTVCGSIDVPGNSVAATQVNSLPCSELFLPVCIPIIRALPTVLMFY